MKWNWQNAKWPNFRYDAASVIPLEQKFLQSAGEVIGAVRHFNEDDSNQLRTDFRIVFTMTAEFRMISTVFQSLGAQLLAVRKKRNLSQPALAERLGRKRARISELERNLANNRLGRDRLTLFAELFDTLNVRNSVLPSCRVTGISMAQSLATRSYPTIVYQNPPIVTR